MSYGRLLAGVVAAGLSWGQDPPTWDQRARQKGDHDTPLRPSSAADRQFFLRALGENWKQVQLGQLAVKQTTTLQVTELAQKLIEEHGNMSKELVALGQRKGWDLPSPFQSESSRDTSASTRSAEAPTRRPSHSPEIKTRGPSGGLSPDTYASMRGEARMGELSSLTGKKFDVQYVKQLITSLERFQSEAATAAKNCKDAELKAFAARTVQRTQQQIGQTKTVRDHLEAQTTAGRKIGFR